MQSAQHFTLFLYGAFFVQLLRGGASVRRSLGVLGEALLFAAGFGALFGLLMRLESAQTAEQAFWLATNVVSIVTLPRSSMSRARDFVLTHSSALEIVCVNVLMVVVCASADPSPWDNPRGLVQSLLLNPLGLLMPEGLGWLGLGLSLWPSALAVVLVIRVGPGGRVPRFILSVWLQLLSIVWLVTTLNDAVRTLDHSSPATLLVQFVALTCFAQILLLYLTLLEAVSGDRIITMKDVPDSARKIGVARRLADCMEMSKWSLWIYAAAGVGACLAGVWFVRRTATPDAVETIFFATLIVAGISETSLRALRDRVKT